MLNLPPCPWTDEQLLDIKFLRGLGVIPHYFGLGFIQLKLSEHWRIHFWMPSWPTIPGAETEFHDHRYDFISKVLHGRLEQEVFEVGPTHPKYQDGDLEIFEVSCQPGQEKEPEVVGLSMKDLADMARVTQRAFKNGQRK